ncbi:MAG: hypothetical protein QOE79_1009 [Sphingomonadales bacterium]|nr:hypothetical protein [Sphingomonadales bacterium]
MALSYDDNLVAEADRMLSRFTQESLRGTVEYSREIARLLAQIGQRWEGKYDGDLPESRAFEFLTDRLDAWWRWFTGRTERVMHSPIVVEVTAGKEFGSETSPDRRMAGEYPYRVRVRRSRGARLQAAASGGWITDRSATPARRGTTGGFLMDKFSGRTWSVTAAHVCGDCTGYARAMPMPKAAPLIRQHAGSLLSAVGIRRYRDEACPPFWSSWPEIVDIPRCTATQTPETKGLDVALHHVTAREGLLEMEIVALADVSPMLDLTFCGAASGLRHAAPTALSIWHSYEFAGTHRCIHDCVQIRLVDRPYIRTDLSRSGDSGAWLVARGRTGLNWVGLLTGGDGDRAGIVPADRITNALESELYISAAAFI